MSSYTATIFEVGRQATANLTRLVQYRADGWVRLSLGQDQADYARSPEESRGIPLAARVVHYHPLKQQTWTEALIQLRSLHQKYGLPVHGFSPQWLAQKAEALQAGALDELKSGGLVSLSWPSGDLGKFDDSCRSFGDWDIPKVASFHYTPETTQAQVEQRVAQLLQLRNLASLLPLPIGLGDRVLVASRTTEGGFDARIIAWTQIASQQKASVGASWGSLGWKMAQPLIAFGCNRLAGWGLEEAIAYGPKARPNSWIGEEEVRLGIAEGGRTAAAL